MIARIPRTRKNFVLLCVVWAFTILALLLQHADAKEDEGDPSCINQEQFVHPAENPHLDVNGDDDDDDSDDDDDEDDEDDDDDDDEDDEEDYDEDDEDADEDEDDDDDEDEGGEEVETGVEHDPWNSVAQEVEGRERAATLEILKQTRIYMTTEVSKTEYDDVRNKCLLQHRLCSFWAAIGECQVGNYMALSCAPACQTCHLLRYDPAEIREVSSPVKGFNEYLDEDEDEDEKEWWEEKVETGFEHDPWNSVAQEVEGPERVATHEILKQTRIYMTTEVSKTEYDDVRDKCLLQHRLCSFWAAIGECQDSSKHMALNCAPTCQTCHLLRYDPAEIGEVSSPVKGFNDYIINQVWRHMSDVSFSLKKPVPKPEPPRRSGIGQHKEKRRRRDRRTLA